MSVRAENASPTDPISFDIRGVARVATLLALVGLADWLTFSQAPGLGLAICFVALTTAVLGLNWRRRAMRWRLACLALLSLAAALTFAEGFALHWALVALVLNSILALEASGQLARFGDWLGPLVRFAVLAPVRLIADSLATLAAAGRMRVGARLWRGALAWLVPAVFAVVFVALFAEANPLIEDAIKLIRVQALLDLVAPERIFFWALVAVVIWPVLVPRLLTIVGGDWQGPLQPTRPSVVFGTAAIRNGLVLFNALFAAQSVMDGLFLWGGVRLPDGLSYADYAHRGAYPLIVTALLAAGFVLVAMRRGGAGEASRLIRALVYLWVLQNVGLVVSSILRLKLYVDVYGLTELRFYAGIWMALVAVGLVLIIAKVASGLTNRWLVMANLVALLVALWAVALVNVPALIGWFNVLDGRDIGRGGAPVDLCQMDELGPETIPALDYLLAHATVAGDDKAEAIWRLRRSLGDAVMAQQGDWRGWTWRRARLHDYLARHALPPEPQPGSEAADDPTVSVPVDECRAF